MKNNELEQWLKKGKVPERDESFWVSFPQTVLRGIRRNTLKPVPHRRHWKSGFAFGGIGIAAACVVGSLWFGSGDKTTDGTKEQLIASQKYFREVASLFPNQMRAIIFEKGEARLLLSDKTDVPPSPPLFVRFCLGNQCRNLITFSGQTIQFNGEQFEILSNRKGEILVVGNNSVWSSSGPQTKNRFIHAQALEL